MTSALSNTYSRLPVAFTHGKGVWLWDAEGRRYLDGLAGIGVSCLGHGHPGLVAAISEQAARVIHTSNLYEIPQQQALAERICSISAMTEVVFGNSGAEANEAAIKLARLYGYNKGNDLPTIITMESSWHGRTIGTLAATDSDKARKGFGPLPGGFIKVTYNDLDAIRQAAEREPRVVAVLLVVFGLSLFSTFTAYVASFFLEKTQLKEESELQQLIHEVRRLRQKIESLEQAQGREPAPPSSVTNQPPGR